MSDRACLTCGRGIRKVRGQKHIGLAQYCTDECKPRCEVDWCNEPQRGRWCALHANQQRLGIDFKPSRYTNEWVCVVCGKDVERGSGRRKHCSGACQQADARHKGKRPTSAVCLLCKCEFSLLRKAGQRGRLQRADTKFCPECNRSPDASRFKRYGITPDEYREAIANGCQICGRTDRTLHIDHDHNCCAPDGNGDRRKTCGNCVRGFLCGPCNRAIGLLGEDVSAIANALKYVGGQ